MTNPKIVLLAGRGGSTNIIFHALNKIYPIACIILEKPVGKKEFLQKRVKKLGIGKVAGQILFQFFIVKFFDLTTAKRKKEIMEHYQMDCGDLPQEILFRVNSVNDPNCIQQLQDINPDLVIVNGTRIISKQVLNCISAKFINIHAGITPMYRGVHGAYWALVNNDADHCGVTVHFLDTGIDTGEVIFQQPISLYQQDNFVTYPLIQLGVGVGLLFKAIDKILNNDVSTMEVSGKSRLWSHPGIFQYLYFRFSRNIK